MGDVDDYIAGLPSGAERSELERLHRLILDHVPEAGQSTSYSMACYTFRERPIAAIVVRKHHIAWYPYSGGVIPQLADRLDGYAYTAGALRFTPSQPLDDDLVYRLLDLRMALG